MKSFLLLALACSLLFECSNKKIDVTDVERLIDAELTENENILSDIDWNANGSMEKKAYRIVSKRHKSLLIFFDSLSHVERYAYKRSVSFYKRNFNDFRDGNNYANKLNINEKTPVELIKLMLLQAENRYLLNWKDVVTLRFDKIEAVITTNKTIYKKGEQVEGTVFLASYTEQDTLGYELKLNGKNLVVKKGKDILLSRPENLRMTMS